MTPKFAEAVDPIFLHVLDLLERITGNESPVASDERVRIRSWIDQAEATLGQRPEWQLAKYALVAWIDDVLIEAPWPGRTWWEENALEVELFNTRDAFTAFYTKAAEASMLTHKDALEVFYICVVLGFRGLYRDAEAAVTLTESLGLPPNLEAWAKKAAMAIQLGQGRPPIAEAAKPGGGAPPLEGKFVLVGASLVGVILAAFTVILAWVLFFNPDGSGSPGG